MIFVHENNGMSPIEKADTLSDGWRFVKLKFLFCDKSLWSMRKVCAHLFYSRQVDSKGELRCRKQISNWESVIKALRKFFLSSQVLWYLSQEVLPPLFTGGLREVFLRRQDIARITLIFPTQSFKHIATRQW